MTGLAPDGGLYVPVELPSFSSEQIAFWLPREQQIFAAEALAPLEALLNRPEDFRNEEVLWFIDNEAALSSLIRGTARPEDVGEIALAVHLLAAELNLSLIHI